jgi:hypothetical protein
MTNKLDTPEQINGDSAREGTTGGWWNDWLLLIAGSRSAILSTAMDSDSLPDVSKQAWAAIVGH